MYINYNTGYGFEEVKGTLEEVKEIAKKGLAYTQKSCDIYDKIDTDERPIACWTWNGIKADDDAKENEIVDFGDFGYYSWIEY